MSRAISEQVLTYQALVNNFALLISVVGKKELVPTLTLLLGVRVGWLCCPGIERAPLRETRSHLTLQGMLDHGRLSSLSHCVLILT